MSTFKHSFHSSIEMSLGRDPFLSHHWQTEACFGFKVPVLVNAVCNLYTTSGINWNCNPFQRTNHQLCMFELCFLFKRRTACTCHFANYMGAANRVKINIVHFQGCIMYVQDSQLIYYLLYKAHALVFKGYNIRHNGDMSVNKKYE